jgi:hypothetical protein
MVAHELPACPATPDSGRVMARKRRPDLGLVVAHEGQIHAGALRA